MSASKIIRTIKSITAKQIFKLHQEVKEQLWGGEFWTKGYYVNTVLQGSLLTISQLTKELTEVISENL
jgi:REP element-mobilizing transposase RayT